MIEWNTPKRGGRAGSAAYMAISVTGPSSTTGKHHNGQLVIRFGPTAVRDLRLIVGDRVVLGLDKATKQVCFKRTTEVSGYKISGKAGGSLCISATMALPVIHVQTIDKSDVKAEGTHVAIFCPALFNLTPELFQVAV